MKSREFKKRYIHGKGVFIKFKLWHRVYDIGISAGTGDDVYLFVGNNLLTVYVLNVREGLGYIGLEEFQVSKGVPYAKKNSECFFQGDQTMELSSETRKKDIFSYAPINQAKMLLQYLTFA